MNVRACYRLRSFKKLRGFILLLLGGSIVVDLARVVMDAVLPEPSGVKSAVVVREAGKQKKCFYLSCFFVSVLIHYTIFMIKTHHLSVLSG